MNAINKEVLDRYFSGRCTLDEAERVLEWLDTPAGRRYLNKRMSQDMAEGASSSWGKTPEAHAEAPYVPTEDLFRRISQTVHEDLYSRLSHAEQTSSGKTGEQDKYVSMKFVPSLQSLDGTISKTQQALQADSDLGQGASQSVKAVGKVARRQVVHARPWADVTGFMLKMAAVFLVALTAWGIYRYAYNEVEPVDRIASTGVFFHTAEDEQRRIRLTDGTVIRLNGQSEIRIDEFNGIPGRHVELKGEAFFEVTYNPDNPFYVHANNSVVKVLGTSFNVSSFAENEYVQVSVLQGRVAFTRDTGLSEGTSITLDSGQSARLDTRLNRLELEPFGAENAISWFTRRLRFDALPFEHVCTQLSRFYGLECIIRDEELKHLRLTSDFSMDSLDKTLSVIAMTLEVGYTLEDDTVFWHY